MLEEKLNLRIEELKREYTQNCEKRDHLEKNFSLQPRIKNKEQRLMALTKYKMEVKEIETQNKVIHRCLDLLEKEKNEIENLSSKYTVDLKESELSTIQIQENLKERKQELLRLQEQLNAVADQNALVDLCPQNSFLFEMIISGIFMGMVSCLAMVIAKSFVGIDISTHLFLNIFTGSCAVATGFEYISTTKRRKREKKVYHFYNQSVLEKTDDQILENMIQKTTEKTLQVQEQKMLLDVKVEKLTDPETPQTNSTLESTKTFLGDDSIENGRHKVKQYHL